jgi:hypothetical protein
MLNRDDYISLLICFFCALTIHTINVWYAGVYISPTKFIAINISVMSGIVAYGSALYFINCRKKRERK